MENALLGQSGSTEAEAMPHLRWKGIEIRSTASVTKGLMKVLSFRYEEQWVHKKAPDMLHLILFSVFTCCFLLTAHWKIVAFNSSNVTQNVTISTYFDQHKSIHQYTFFPSLSESVNFLSGTVICWKLQSLVSVGISVILSTCV